MGINRRTEDILITIFCVGIIIMLGWVIAMPKDTVPEEVVEEEVVALPPEPVVDEDQMHCLALNIYHEARGDNFAGQVAVADVTMNRVESSRYPNTICEVVREAKLSEWWLEQGKEVPVRHQCQFSWYCDGKSDEPRDMRAWGQALTVASEVMRGNYPDLTKGAMFYHANYVDPYWNTSMMHVAYIGEHLFYKHPKY